MTVLYQGRLVDVNIRKKAPQNMMYHINTISFTNLLAVAGVAILILDRWRSITTTQDVVDIDTGDIVAHFGLATDGENLNLTDLNLMTKFITISKSDAQSVNCMVTIYGELVNASRLQLIIEWFRKGGL